MSRDFRLSQNSVLSSAIMFLTDDTVLLPQVDHSIVTYLVDPSGEFSQHFGQKISAEEAAEKIQQKIKEYEEDQGS